MKYTASVTCPTTGKKFSATLTIKKEINLVITFQILSYEAIRDTLNNTFWKVHLIKDLSDIADILQPYQAKKIKIKNLAFVHHGNTYSSKIPHIRNQKDKFVVEYKAMHLNASKEFEESSDLLLTESVDLKKIMDAVNVSEPNFFKKISFYKDCDLTDKLSMPNFIQAIKKDASEIHYDDAFLSRQSKILVYQKLLFDAVEDGGCYFSIACQEGKDEEEYKQLSRLTAQKIKIYANTVDVLIGRLENFGNKESAIFLNMPLTDQAGSNGWEEFDLHSQPIKITGINKDLILYSNKWNSPSPDHKPYGFIPLNQKFDLQKTIKHNSIKYNIENNR